MLAIIVVLGAALIAGGCGSGSSDDSKQAKSKPKAEPPKTLKLVEQGFDEAKPADWIIGDRGRIVDDAIELRAGPGEVARSGSVKDLEVDDVQVSVTGSSDDIKADDAAYGVVCRWIFDGQGDSKDYYSFTVAPNGYAAIGTSDDILWQADKPVKAINTGHGVANEIRAECIGDKLSLYVNDDLVKTVTSDKIPRGDVGLVFENYAKKGTYTAVLDDFLAEQVLSK
jgi:hypothetical protein